MITEKKWALRKSFINNKGVYLSIIRLTLVEFEHFRVSLAENYSHTVINYSFT